MAIGFLECAGYGAVLYAMDRACKAADIEIIGIDTINPKDASAFIPLTAQVKFAGSVDDVKVACEVARRAALKLDVYKRQFQYNIFNFGFTGYGKHIASFLWRYP